MGTRQLDNQQLHDLQPAYGLWKQYQPENARYGFRSKSLAEAQEWQQHTRQALAQTIGFQSLPGAALAPQTVEEVDRGDYLREKILLRTSPYAVMPVYILIPKQGSKPFPVMLAFHGHSYHVNDLNGYGVKDIVGLWEDGEERNTPEDYQKDFAVALCKRGFAVAAPEISCFGERQTDFSYLNTTIGQEAPTTCAHTAMLAFHLGGSVVGLRVHDGKCLVNYLETRGDLDTTRLGAMGISGGGMQTFFSACLDERIKACVVSGYYCMFRESILAMHHCPCNFVPGLHQFGEIYDLAGLLAPRPLLIEAGNYDPIFPFAAVQKTVERTKAVYAVFDAQDKLETDYFEGRHRISGQRAYDFLMEHLS